MDISPYHIPLTASQTHCKGKDRVQHVEKRVRPLERGYEGSPSSKRPPTTFHFLSPMVAAYASRIWQREISVGAFALQELM